MKQSIIAFIITGVVTICGVKFMGAGENIAWGQRSPEEVMNGWMNSSGHRANILNSSFKKNRCGILCRSKRKDILDTVVYLLKIIMHETKTDGMAPPVFLANINLLVQKHICI